MNGHKHASSPVADGYTLNIPPTFEQIEAVQRRMASYTESDPPRPDRLERLASRLHIFSDTLYAIRTDECNRAAQTIKELADLAINSADDIRNTLQVD